MDPVGIGYNDDLRRKGAIYQIVAAQQNKKKCNGHWAY